MGRIGQQSFSGVCGIRTGKSRRGERGKVDHREGRKRRKVELMTNNFHGGTEAGYSSLR